MRLLLASVLALASCRGAPAPRATSPVPGPDAALVSSSSPPDASCSDAATEEPVDAARPPLTPRLEARLRERAREVLAALAAKDMSALAALADPVRGVRFSPYSYVDAEADVVLSPAELRRAMRDSRMRTWGSADGTGDPITSTFATYYRRFVWSGDFLRVTEGTVDQGESTGNTEDNLAAVYASPAEHFVEMFVPGTETFGGMNWQSLRLVFAEAAGGEGGEGGDGGTASPTLRLVGIVHGQWTI